MTVQGKLAGWSYLGETRKRSWVKSIVWRMTGVLLLGGLAWVFTGNWQETTWITVSFHAVRVVLYYYHERAWDKISWGRKKLNG